MLKLLKTKETICREIDMSGSNFDPRRFKNRVLQVTQKLLFGTAGAIYPQPTLKHYKISTRETGD